MFEPYALIEELGRKSTTSEVLDCVQSIAAPLGLVNLHIGGLPSHCFQTIDEATRWPSGFRELYIREDYARVSPVSSRGRDSPGPFEWRTADFASHENPAARRVMEHAADFGHRYGFVVPVHGPHGFEGSVSLDGSVVELADHLKPGLHLFALYAFDRVRTILRARAAAKPALTSREREVLAWAANGKSAWEIGEILNIAKRTVDDHAETAFQKLGAVNRTHAVAIALRDRMIEP